MPLAPGTRRAWLLHDSGAMGTDYAAVLVVGTGTKMATCIGRTGRRFRTSIGNLVDVRGAAPEWAEDYERHHPLALGLVANREIA